MLPSMPCLNFSERSELDGVKGNTETIDLHQVAKIVEDVSEENGQFDGNCASETENMKVDNLFVQNTSDDKDNLEEINAIMLASSTVRNVREKKEITLANKKKAKRRKQYLATVAMLTPPDPIEEKYRLENFAQIYFEKLEETLEEDDFKKAIELFQYSNENESNAVQLYKKLKSVLLPKYQDLLDEFLLFLNVEQAKAVGKLIPFFIMSNMVKFLRNLDCYFKDQPSQLRKIHKYLLDLNDSADVSLDKVKSTILPLLRSNALLCDSFLQIFLEEKPTNTLFNGAWEVIDLSKELLMLGDESVPEFITVSDIEDPSCVCSCHKIDEQQPSKNHCLKCGLRFVQGKMYCQTGKGLRPVNVVFPSNVDIDHNKRLGVQNRTKRFDQCSTKNFISPNKEVIDESRLPIEGEDDDRKKNIKRCRPVKRTKVQQKKFGFISKANKPWQTKGESRKSIIKSPSKRNQTRSLYLVSEIDDEKVVNNKSDSSLKSKASCSSGQLKSHDGMCWGNLPSPEYIDIHSSDSDFSSDELIKLSPNKLEISGARNDESCCDMWTREEDKIILETFQQKFDQEAIELIAQQLKNRSIHDISARFERLMVLLHEMET